MTRDERDYVKLLLLVGIFIVSCLGLGTSIATLRTLNELMKLVTS